MHDRSTNENKNSERINREISCSGYHKYQKNKTGENQIPRSRHSFARSAKLRLSVSPGLNRVPDGIIRIRGEADFVAGERDKVDLA